MKQLGGDVFDKWQITRVFSRSVSHYSRA